jgi:hypothetical protein
MQHYRPSAAKHRTCCGSCWSRYNARLICILQMQMLLQQLLETVLVTDIFNRSFLPYTPMSKAGAVE